MSGHAPLRASPAAKMLALGALYKSAPGLHSETGQGCPKPPACKAGPIPQTYQAVGTPPWAPLARSLGSLTRKGTVSELLRSAPSGAGFVTGVVRTRTESRGIWSHDDSGQPPARRLGDYRQQPPPARRRGGPRGGRTAAVRCCQSAAYSTVQYSTVQQRTVIFILDLCDLI